eukprot:g4767.t1
MGNFLKKRRIENGVPAPLEDADLHHFIPQNWAKLELELKKVNQICSSQYTNFYAKAAAILGWNVEVVSKKRSEIFVRPPNGAPGFMIRKHKLACLQCPGSARLMKNKFSTYVLLGKKKLPVPPTTIVHPDNLTKLTLPKRSKPPYVIKPIKGSQGKGVVMNLHTLEDVKCVLQKQFTMNCSPCLVQQQFFGYDYRILLLDGKIQDVALRFPARVKGDGVCTTEELVKQHNQVRKRNHIPTVKKSMQLGPFEDIPAKDKWRIVQDKANLSLGGEVFNYLDTAFYFPISAMHTHNKKFCERIAAMFPHQRIIGIDFIGNLCKSYKSYPGCIIELNSNPQVFSHSIRNGKANWKVLQDILKSGANASLEDCQINASYYRKKQKAVEEQMRSSRKLEQSINRPLEKKKNIMKSTSSDDFEEKKIIMKSTSSDDSYSDDS